MFFSDFGSYFFPAILGPSEPFLLVLIENVKRLVAEFGKLSTPTGPSLDRTIVQNFPNHENFLGAVDLMPDALQNFF